MLGSLEAAQYAGRPSNPWHQLYNDLAKRAGKNPAKAAVSRKILIAAWHVLSRQQPFRPAAPRRPAPASASSLCFLAARRPCMESRSRDSSHEHSAPTPAPKEK